MASRCSGIDHDDTLTAEICARPAGPAPSTPREHLHTISQLLRASRRLLCCGAERRRSPRVNSVRLAWIQHELAVLEWTTLVEPGERICAHVAWQRALRNHRDADSVSATPLLEHMLLIIICSVIDSPDTAEDSVVLYLRESCTAVKRVFLNRFGWLLATLHVNEASASAGADGAPGSILGKPLRLAADVMGPAESALGQREKYEEAGDRGTQTRAAIVLGKMLSECVSCPRCVLFPLATALADAVVRHLGASACCAPDEGAMRVWFLTSLLLPLARCMRLSVGAAKGTGAAMEGEDAELLRRIFRNACLTVFRLLCSESVRGGAGPVPRTTLDDDGTFGCSDEDRLVYVLHALLAASPPAWLLAADDDGSMDERDNGHSIGAAFLAGLRGELVAMLQESSLNGIPRRLHDRLTAVVQHLPRETVEEEDRAEDGRNGRASLEECWSSFDRSGGEGEAASAHLAGAKTMPAQLVSHVRGSDVLVLL